MSTESEKCRVQAGLEGTVGKFWELRKVVKLWNCAVELPWRTITMHYTVPMRKVISLRTEIAQCFAQLGPDEVELLSWEDL